jgi:hypothetical protein
MCRDVCDLWCAGVVAQSQLIGVVYAQVILLWEDAMIVTTCRQCCCSR